MGVTPLTLSLSPWERGPLNYPQWEFRRSLSHWERDRVRGDSAVRSAVRRFRMRDASFTL